MYRDGLGVSVDGRRALYWFDRAAKQGSPDAYNAVGELYLGHSDVSEDVAEARRFFLIGATLDHAGAMYNLGLIYLAGRGVTQDEIQAYKWFTLAQAAAGEERDSALGALTALAERLTPVQVGMAVTAANNWLRVTRRDLCEERCLAHAGL